MVNQTSEPKFRQARWSEDIILEKGSPGERGIFVPQLNEKTKQELNYKQHLPKELLRKTPPGLPELSQMQVLRHYLRLSQETLGADLNIDIGLGTCTMKYSPKIHESFVRSTKSAELHPYQDESTVQGMLEVIYKMDKFCQEISGMDRFSFQPTGGTQAIYSNLKVLKAYLTDINEENQRTEIITTMLSHPGNPGAASTAGFRVITLMPGSDGLPDYEVLKSVVSDKTAALLITNPEDTGIFNHRIKKFTDLVHSVGGLCIYDHANLNGVLGIIRAKESGFDMVHYNLHKTFSSPHGSQGPGTGAQGVIEKLVKYLPSPLVNFDGKKYYFEKTSEKSIGKLRKFYGVPPVVLRAYSYIMSLGAKGLLEVAELSILNNNYFVKKMLEEVKGLSLPFAKGVNRIEQVRFSWQKLKDDTGVGTDDVDRRIVDFGFQSYFTSHHPYLIPEPFTPEPVETYSKEDIDEYIAAFVKISQEAYQDPQKVINSPYNAALSAKIDIRGLTEYDNFACTWRAFKKYVLDKKKGDKK